MTNKDLILMKKAYLKTLRENTSGGNQIQYTTTTFCC